MPRPPPVTTATRRSSLSFSRYIRRTPPRSVSSHPKVERRARRQQDGLRRQDNLAGGLALLGVLMRRDDVAERVDCNRQMADPFLLQPPRQVLEAALAIR